MLGRVFGELQYFMMVSQCWMIGLLCCFLRTENEWTWAVWTGAWGHNLQEA